MPSHFVKKLFVMLFLLFISCDYDPSSLFNSSEPSERHSKSEVTPLPQSASRDIIDSSNFSFLIIADTHYGKYTGALKAVERLHDSVPFEMLFIAGDITQTSLTKEWDLFADERAALSVPLYCVMGNHDLMNDNGDNFFDYFGPSHYTVQVGNLLIIILDSGNGTYAKEQQEWYEEVLANTTATEIVVLTHYAVLSEAFQHPVASPYPAQFYWLTEVNNRYGVNSFISGHLHENLYKNIRGVNYYNLTNFGNPEEPQGLLVTYANGELSYERIAVR